MGGNFKPLLIFYDQAYSSYNCLLVCLPGCLYKIALCLFILCLYLNILLFVAIFFIALIFEVMSKEIENMNNFDKFYKYTYFVSLQMLPLSLVQT